MEEIAGLVSFLSEENHLMDFEAFLSMVDGKVTGVLTECQSMQRCPFCHLLWREYKDIGREEFNDWDISPVVFDHFCLAILHFGLRLLEHLLKIGFQMEFEEYRLREIHEESFKLYRARILAKFKDEKGLSLCMPRAGGHGTTNNGNMARRVLADPEFFSECTGISADLIRNLNYVWIAIRESDLQLDPEKFGQFCDAVHDQYREELPWAEMSPSLHKILRHGPRILEFLPETLNCGMLSEEPLENNHKTIKYDEILHARQCSGLQRREDVFLREMDRSSPDMVLFMAEKRLKQRKKAEIPQAVLDLCKT